MKDIYARYDELKSIGNAVSLIAVELQRRPMAAAKLFAIKATRSWYGTDSQRFETPILLLQIPYLFLILCSSIFSWRQEDAVRQLTVNGWLIILYFWVMNILSTTLVRYMVAVMGLSFLLLPAIFQPKKHESQLQSF